jgi:hypothetical protein
MWYHEHQETIAYSEFRQRTLWDESDINGAQGRDRTTDTRIFSPLLYQLSYLGPLRRSMRRSLPRK